MAELISFPAGLDKNFDDIPNTITFEIYERKTLSKSPASISTIVLPAPSNIGINSGSSWKGVAFGYAGKDLTGTYGSSNPTTLSSVKTAAADYYKNFIGIGTDEGFANAMFPNQLGYGLLSMAIQGLGGDASAEDLIGANKGQIINPYLSASYQGTDLRNFEFSFSFFPKSAEDCDTIKLIIDEFNEAHLPGKGQDGTDKWYLEYPREFDIYININGQHNPYLIPYKTSVMTSFSVDYTGGLGFFNTFPNGFPIQTNLKIAFMETEQQTRESVYKKKNRGVQ